MRRDQRRLSLIASPAYAATTANLLKNPGAVQSIFDRVDGTYNYGFADNLALTLKNV